MSRINLLFQFLRFLPWTLRFNFHYLPFSQAIKLPILLYKPKLLTLNGIIRISGGVKFGMIKLGFNQVSIYPNSGITWSNSGTVIFKGRCNIGNASAISIGEKSILTIGDNVRATTALKLVCYHRIDIGEQTLIGWENIICDTDFHSVMTTTGKTKGYDSIIIGPHNWLAMQSLILKGTQTPPFTVVGARSTLNKNYVTHGEKILLAGSPATLKCRDIYLDRQNDKIIYES